MTRDSFVRCQTTTATYARCRQYKSLKDDTTIYWQYERLKGWLKPWKITIVADDKTGLSYEQIDIVLSPCRYYRFLIIEVAIDFSHSTGVNREFVRQHAVFGKSRRAHTIQDCILYWGGRKSEKLVRSYDKKEVAGYRVELELHSPLLRDEHISTLEDFDGLPDTVYPKHFQFVTVDWDRLKRHLTPKRNSQALISGAKQRGSSLSRLRRYLRRNGITNFHRFLVPHAINKRIDRAFTRWSGHFEGASCRTTNTK
ncbi:MAG TPA: hypothetical protein VFQ43_05390 [Nitrososphaera sp.]|nr:hypothetical protein [Nitrososphaera sp.]